MARIVDVSNNNGAVDWRAVQRAGIRNAWLKVAEGRHFIDGRYRENRIMATACGVRTGAYYFGHPSVDPIASADFFLSLFKLHPGDLLPVLDLETADGLSSMVIESWARKWLRHVEQKIGAKPVLYSGDYFMRANRLDTIDCPKWVASYGAKPRVHYAAWQYTDHELVGTKTVVDCSFCPNLAAVTYKPSPIHVVKKPVEPLRRWWFERQLIASRKSETRL